MIISPNALNHSTTYDFIIIAKSKTGKESLKNIAVTTLEENS